MESEMRNVVMGYCVVVMLVCGVKAWTGEIHGRVVCDVCGDSSIGPEDHVLEVFMQVQKWPFFAQQNQGKVLNYQAFTNDKGVYSMAETMPESDRWDACLARLVSSFHEQCTELGKGSNGVKFSYDWPAGRSHTAKTFVYRPAEAPTYCI